MLKPFGILCNVGTRVPDGVSGGKTARKSLLPHDFEGAVTISTQCQGKKDMAQHYGKKRATTVFDAFSATVHVLPETASHPLQPVKTERGTPATL